MGLTPMISLPFIDAHHHLWDIQRLSYDWLSEVPQLNRNYTLPEFQGAVGAWPLEQSVFVQSEVARDESLDEVAWVSELATLEPRIGGIVAWAPVESIAALASMLQQLRRFPLVKGVRRLLQTESEDFCRDADLIRGVESLAAQDLSFDLCIYHRQLAAATELVRACPQVRFVLDHCGKPDIRNRQLDPWRSQIQQLSEFPNVWCKLSGLITEGDPSRWTIDDLRPYVNHVIDCFGCERLMFGSDWPVVCLAGSYASWGTAVWELVRDRTMAERTQLFHETALKFYRL